MGGGTSLITTLHRPSIFHGDATNFNFLVNDAGTTMVDLSLCGEAMPNDIRA